MTFARARSTLRYRGLGMADSILSSVIRRRLRAGLSQPSARPPSPSETKHALIIRTATSRGNTADSSTIIRGRRGATDDQRYLPEVSANVLKRASVYARF